MKHFYVVGAIEFYDKKTDSTFVKLGFAKDVSLRLSYLQTGCPFELVVHDAGMIRDAKSFETFVHLAFKDKKHRGEWYNLKRNDVFMLYDHIDNARIECDCRACLGFYAAARQWRNNPNWVLEEGRYGMRETAPA